MNRLPLSRVDVTLPRPGVEPGSPRPQRGILTTILPWREFAVDRKAATAALKQLEPGTVNAQAKTCSLTGNRTRAAAVKARNPNH
jgi:hypothetical protein